MLRDVPKGFEDAVEWTMRLNTTMMQLYEAAVTGDEPNKIDPYTIGAKLTVFFELRDGIAIAAYPSPTDQARIARRVTMSFDVWWKQFGGTWPEAVAPSPVDFSKPNAMKGVRREFYVGFPEMIPLDRAPWDYVITSPGTSFRTNWPLLTAEKVAEGFVYA